MIICCVLEQHEIIVNTGCRIVHSESVIWRAGANEFTSYLHGLLEHEVAEDKLHQIKCWATELTWLHLWLPAASLLMSRSFQLSECLHTYPC